MSLISAGSISLDSTFKETKKTSMRSANNYNKALWVTAHRPVFFNGTVLQNCKRPNWSREEGEWESSYWLNTIVLLLFLHLFVRFSLIAILNSIIACST